jgi:hypothetical protein
MGFWIFRIQAHPCHLTANSPPLAFRQRALPHSGSLLTFLTASEKHCALSYGSLCVFSHVPQQIASSSLNFVAVQITKYQMLFYTVHSSQFIAHSSQLTAHTPAVPIFRDRLTPATELSKHPSEKAYRGSYPYVTRRIFFLWCPWTNLSKPPVNKTSPNNIPSKHETDSPHSNAVFPETKLPNQVPDQRACTSRPGGVSTSAMAPVRSSDLVLLTAAMNRFVHVRSVASPQPPSHHPPITLLKSPDWLRKGQSQRFQDRKSPDTKWGGVCGKIVG